MIRTHPYPSGEQRKLALSVGVSFLSRIPGAIGLLWFLPLLHFGLGTDGYANLLSAMALANVASFLTGGFHLIGRRMIGEAYAHGDQAGEANAFVSVLVVNLVALGIALAIIGVYCWLDRASTGFFIVAMLSALGASIMMFENVRSAYNEHYVTATLLIIIQCGAYAIGFLVTEIRQDIVQGSLVILAPYWLASLVSFGLLLRHKPYLISGRPIVIWFAVRQGIMLAMADGFLFATLSLSVVWLQTSTIATTAAWFATIVRLFQTFLMPITLVMLPLSSYIRILWNGKSIAQQQAYTKATLAFGFGYGAIVAVALFIVSRIYVGWMLDLPVPDDWSIFVLFGAIVAYKCYSSVAYVVLNETAHLSSWITMVVGVSAVIGATTSITVDPLRAIDFYAVIAGVLMLAVLLWNAARFIRLPIAAM